MPERRQQKTPQKTNTETSTVVNDSVGSVTYSLAITKQTAPYESVKLSTSVTIPHGATDEYIKQLDDLVIIAKEKVVTRLTKDLDEVTNL